MNDKQDMLDRLMQSISSIDDDLLLDVEPAKKRGVISMPQDRTDDRSETATDRPVLRVSSDRGKRKRMSNRKIWISAASVAACLVIVFGSLIVRNLFHKAAAPESAAKHDVPEWGSDAPGDDMFSDVDIMSGEWSRNNQTLDDLNFVKVTESLNKHSAKPSSFERGHDLSRGVMRVADQTAAQVLAQSNVNTLYSPFNVYQTIVFLAESAEGKQLFGDVLGIPEDEFVSGYYPYLFSEDAFSAQNIVLMGESLYNRCDQALLASICEKHFFDTYILKGDSGTSNGDAAPIEIRHSANAIQWKPADELLLMFRYLADVEWTGSISSVDLSQGVFHAPHQTYTDVPFFDSDDASLRHFELDGAVACELPVRGGSLYLILPSEGVTPEDLLGQSHFFTRLLSAEPEGKNGVARFPALNILSRRNLVDPVGIRALRDLTETPMSLKWLEGEAVTFPLIDQDIDFTLDGPVRKPDEYDPDAVSCMSLEVVYDRPFIFCLTDETYNMPLLIGVYRYPEQ